MSIRQFIINKMLNPGRTSKHSVIHNTINARVINRTRDSTNTYKASFIVLDFRFVLAPAYMFQVMITIPCVHVCGLGQFVMGFLVTIRMQIRFGTIFNWKLFGRNSSVVCFSKTLPLLLSTGWFQERIPA